MGYFKDYRVTVRFGIQDRDVTKSNKWHMVVISTSSRNAIRHGLIRFDQNMEEVFGGEDIEILDIKCELIAEEEEDE